MYFCGNSTGIVELGVNGFVANVGIGIVPKFCLYLSDLFLPSPGDPKGLLLDFFARRQMKFFEENLAQKIDFQKRYPVSQIDSMCQAATFCRG